MAKGRPPLEPRIAKLEADVAELKKRLEMPPIVPREAITATYVPAFDKWPSQSKG